MIFSYLLNMQSHPSWVCGLKHTGKRICERRIPVTPFVGVWIETFSIATHGGTTLSHPSWVCGLKLVSLAWKVVVLLSHPSWVCGLKPLYPFSQINQA